ncbi:MAG: amino acid synthesis family protein, partial [Beijerinckiaceae bacterium]|nr:amino acid synthesis family protein [Beijerinckiaceae bacterium]
MPATIRKILTQVDETLIEGGKSVSPPTRRAVSVAVIANPFAGGYRD